MNYSDSDLDKCKENDATKDNCQIVKLPGAQNDSEGEFTNLSSWQYRSRSPKENILL